MLNIKDAKYKGFTVGYIGDWTGTESHTKAPEKTCGD